MHVHTQLNCRLPSGVHLTVDKWPRVSSALRTERYNLSWAEMEGGLALASGSLPTLRSACKKLHDQSHGKGIMERLYLHKGHSTFLKWYVFVCQDSTPKKTDSPFQIEVNSLDSLEIIFLRNIYTWFVCCFFLNWVPPVLRLVVSFFGFQSSRIPFLAWVTSFWFAKIAGIKWRNLYLLRLL